MYHDRTCQEFRLLFSFTIINLMLIIMIIQKVRVLIMGKKRIILIILVVWIMLGIIGFMNTIVNKDNYTKIINSFEKANYSIKNCQNDYDSNNSRQCELINNNNNIGYLTQLKNGDFTLLSDLDDIAEAKQYSSILSNAIGSNYDNNSNYNDEYLSISISKALNSKVSLIISINEGK